jgi:hypothetical protein
MDSARLHAIDATPHSQAQEKEEDEREARRKAREEMEMKAFLEDKDEAFAEAHQRALEWTDDFAVYAEKKCVETLQRVQREAQAHYDKQLLRQSLRLIRLPWAEKRAIALMNRQKMRNLLRLCAGCGLGVGFLRADRLDATPSTRRSPVSTQVAEGGPVYAEVLEVKNEVPLFFGLDSVGEESQALPHVLGQEDVAEKKT